MGKWSQTPPHSSHSLKLPLNSAPVKTTAECDGGVSPPVVKPLRRISNVNTQTDCFVEKAALMQKWIAWWVPVWSQSAARLLTNIVWSPQTNLIRFLLCRPHFTSLKPLIPQTIKCCQALGWNFQCWNQKLCVTCADQVRDVSSQTSRSDETSPDSLTFVSVVMTQLYVSIEPDDNNVF